MAYTYNPCWRMVLEAKEWMLPTVGYHHTQTSQLKDKITKYLKVKYSSKILKSYQVFGTKK